MVNVEKWLNESLEREELDAMVKDHQMLGNVEKWLFVGWMNGITVN